MKLVLLVPGTVAASTKVAKTVAVKKLQNIEADDDPLSTLLK